MSEVRFRDLVDAGLLLINDGYRAKVSELGGGGPLFLRAGALQDDGFRWVGLDSFAADTRIENKRGRPGDVVITTKGNSTGRVGWVPESAPDFVYSPHLSFWRSLDNEQVVPRYLYYWSRSKAFDVQLRGLAFATDMAPYLSLRDQLELRIDLPDVVEQRRIAAVLGALDELIEADRSQLARLESAARAVAATAPGTCQLRELAEPMGAKQVTPYGVVEHYSLPAFDEGAMPERVAGEQIQSNKLPLANPCVLVSRLNPKWERCWMAYPGANAVASTEFVPLAGTRATSEEVWAVASATEFWDQMRTHVTGTTGSHQRVDKAAVLTLTVPNIRALPAAHRRLVFSLVRAAHGLRDEIADQTRVRDELLPVLMSGKVRVSEDLVVA